MISSTLSDNRFREPAAKEKYSTGNVKGSLSTIFSVAIKVTVPHLPEVVPLIVPCTNPRFDADYQCNNPMSLFRATNFPTPLALGQAIIQNLPHSDIIESCFLAGPGFINIKLTNQWMGMTIQNMLIDGIHSWAPKPPFKTAVVDFSSPNIAKEMHVGHLRSTIIGDTVARMLEFSNVNVLRRNHVGDWGTQFGMLIEFLFDKFPNQEANDQAIGELEAFYKAAKLRFDKDAAFKERAQHAVVKLQSGVEMYVKAWAQICEISRQSYQKVYQRLGIYLEEKGESFYNPYIPDTLDVLRQKGLIKESEGAQVIFLEGKKIPFIVVKRDGGFNYASTDLAALRYRLSVEKAELVIYVTDGSQREHFDMLFSTAELAGWLPTEKSKYPKACHVGFGLVCGDDGKRFRTRSTEVVRLVDLLVEAKSRCKATLVKRGKDAEWTAEELEHIAEAIGYGAVKYADLKNNRLTNYTFNFDQMLNDKGNTAVYLLYAHARICSLIRNSGKHIEELMKNGQLVLKNDEERKLGLHLLQFAEVVEEACTQLLPNVLCEYLYDLSEKFNSFYFQHQVVGSSEETSRLLLCEATAVVMRKCFHLLGITPVYKI